MSKSMTAKTRQSLMGIRNLPYPPGLKSNPTAGGNHGYLSVGKVVVVGSWRREGGGVVTFTTNGPSGGDGNLRMGVGWDNAKWYHLAGVHGAKGGSWQQIYIDGELLTEQQRVGPINWDSHQLVFGARHHNNSFGWHANVYPDDVRFYNRALSAQEVQVQAGAFLNKIYRFVAGLPSAIKSKQTVARYLRSHRGYAAYGSESGWFHRELLAASATGDFTATVKVSNTSGDDSKNLFFRINRGYADAHF